MNKKPGPSKDAADKLVKNIRRKTRQGIVRAIDLDRLLPPLSLRK